MSDHAFILILAIAATCIAWIAYDAGREKARRQLDERREVWHR